MPSLILIIDDSPEDREAIRSYLSESRDADGLAFRFSNAGKGEDGLAAFYLEAPDCIVLDHYLPDMNGLEFLERLKEGFQEIPVAVVVLTGSANESLAPAALRAGAQEYLPKRFLGKELLLRAVQSARDRFLMLANNRRADRALVDNEERLRLTQEAAGIGTWDWQLGSGAVRWSKENFLLHGMNSTTDRPAYGIWQTVIHPDDRDRANAAVMEALADGKGYETEYRVILADGKIRWLSGRGYVTKDDTGQAVRLLGVNIDVTARRAIADELALLNDNLDRRVRERTAELIEESRLRLEAEDQLHQAQKVEAIGQLTSGVAHDFNNVLAAIVGNLELASRRNLDPGVRRFLDRVQDAAERGARLTDHLLSFARGQPLQRVQCDLNRLIDSFGDLLRRTIGPTIDIQLELPNGLWNVMADPNQFEMALLNLAVNARDAMPAGGTLVIATKNFATGSAIVPKTLVAGDYACISVRDTGTGMSKDVAARIFDPFYTTKPAGKGTGLGLSQVYGFSTQLGGTATVTSELGTGSSINIFLPRDPECAGETSEQRIYVPEILRDINPRNARVLVVDDQRDVREVAVDALEALGFVVLAAESGPTGLDILRAHDLIEVAVVDFAMPEMHGLEFIRRARLLVPGLHCLLVTGYADISMYDDASARGIAVLRKPYRMAELASALQQLLAHVQAAQGPVAAPLKVAAWHGTHLLM